MCPLCPFCNLSYDNDCRWYQILVTDGKGITFYTYVPICKRCNK